MDRQQIAQSLLHAAAVLGLAEEGQHTALPVVAVNDRGAEVQCRERVHDGALEKGILLDLRLAAAVDAVAEIVLVVDQIDDDAVEHQLLHTDIAVLPADLGVEVQHMLHAVAILILDDAVIGDHDARVQAERGEGLRQCADHVGETAGFGQRRALRGDQQNRGWVDPALAVKNIAEFFVH